MLHQDCNLLLICQSFGVLGEMENSGVIACDPKSSDTF
jgi:hypothetical protein